MNLKSVVKVIEDFLVRILDKGKSLIGALVKDQDFRNYIKETAVTAVMVLVTCPIPPNPAELVGSKRMKRLNAKQKKAAILRHLV